MNQTENRREIEACRKALHTLDSASEGWNDALRRLRRVSPWPSGCCPLCGRPINWSQEPTDADYNWKYRSRMCGICDIWLQKADPDHPGRPVRPSQAWEESRKVPDQLVYIYNGKIILCRPVPRMKVKDAFRINWNDLLHEAGVRVPEQPVVRGSAKHPVRVPAGVPAVETMRELSAGSQEWQEKMEQAMQHTRYREDRCPFCGYRRQYALWRGEYCPSCNLWLERGADERTPMEWARESMIHVNIPSDEQPKLIIFNSRWEKEGWRVKKPGAGK